MILNRFRFSLRSSEMSWWSCDEYRITLYTSIPWFIDVIIEYYIEERQKKIDFLLSASINEETIMHAWSSGQETEKRFPINVREKKLFLFQVSSCPCDFQYMQYVSLLKDVPKFIKNKCKNIKGTYVDIEHIKQHGNDHHHIYTHTHTQIYTYI